MTAPATVCGNGNAPACPIWLMQRSLLRRWRAVPAQRRIAHSGCTDFDVKTFHPFSFFGLARPALAGALTSLLLAAAHAASAPQLAAGKQIASEKCAACHGLDGNAPNAQFPKLAGQIGTFMSLQLRNYRSGERPNPLMANVAKGLTDAQIDSVTTYYASLPPMKGAPATNEALAKQGQTIYQTGKSGAPACKYCHGAKGEGLAPVFARIGGQHAEFIYASLLPYKSHDDFKNPYAWVMKAVVENWSDADLRAVSAYLGTLP